MSGMYEECIRLGEENTNLELKLKKIRKENRQHKKVVERLINKLSDKEDYFMCPTEKFYTRESCDKITCENCWKKWAYGEDEK